MRRLIPFLLGATAAGGLIAARERRVRVGAERLAAALLETLLRAIDANDGETGRHVRRVARYALILADAAGLDERQRHSVERVALFHDIGKIHEALFDLIHDTNTLSREEREAIATHPRRGAEVLAPLAAFYPTLAEGVLAHHERWDGRGYPRRIAGEQIPIESRVVSIADAFDAMTCRRRYSQAISAEDAGRRLRQGSGEQFDPRLVDLFLSPPVFARVRTAMGADMPHPRRAVTHTEPAPDVGFRWRTVTETRT